MTDRPTTPETHIEVEGDKPKVEQTRHYFAEVRASMMNGADALRDAEAEVMRLQTALDDAVGRLKTAEDALGVYDGVMKQAIMELSHHSKELSGWQCDPIDDAVAAMRSVRKRFARPVPESEKT